MILEDNGGKAEGVLGYRTLMCRKHEGTSVDERMFLPPLEYLFFPEKFSCRGERANKAARTVASQFHGFRQKMQLQISLQGVSLVLGWSKRKDRGHDTE